MHETLVANSDIQSQEHIIMNDRQRAKKAHAKKMKRLWHKIDKKLGLPVQVNRNLVSHAPDKVMPKRKKAKSRYVKTASGFKPNASHASFKESSIPRHHSGECKREYGTDTNRRIRYNVTDY